MISSRRFQENLKSFLYDKEVEEEVKWKEICIEEEKGYERFAKLRYYSGSELALK